MAAIDFPNSPTLNQEFTANGRTWIWNGAVWANKVVDTTVSRYNVSDTAPSSPASGDVWFNSTNARTYVYYDSFWVESNPALDGKSGVNAVASPITNSGTQSAAVLGLDYSSLQYGQNYIINGNFDIWQRATTAGPAVLGGYKTADRWFCSAGETQTHSRQTSGAPAGSQYYMRLTAGQSSCFFYQRYYIETMNASQLWGKTVTFSIKMRRNATLDKQVSIQIMKSATVDDGGSGGTYSQIAVNDVQLSSLPTGTSTNDWYTATVSAAIPNDGTANTLQVIIHSDVIANGSVLDLSQAQLEIGGVATPFKRSGGTIQGELAACQRYYYKQLASATYSRFGGAYGIAYATNAITMPFNLPVKMRVSPYSIDYGGAFRVYDTISSLGSVSSIVIVGSTEVSETPWLVVASSGLTQYRPYSLNASGDVSAYIGFNAELQ